MIEAASIELFRAEKRLEARRGVQGLFPQTVDAKASGPRQLWRFRSNQLTYFGAENRAGTALNPTPIDSDSYR